MAKQYTCDICNEPLDHVISIYDKFGALHILREGDKFSSTITLTLSKGSQISDVCFNCIVGEMAIKINARKEVIRADQKK